MRSARTVLRTDDGTDLVLHEWAPEGVPPRATVVVVHGMVEHAGRYARLAAALVGDGYAVMAPDLRGHGLTAGDPAATGHLADADGWALAVADVALVVAHARAARPLAPVVLLGHSMGSLLARTYVLDHGHAVDGLVLTGTAGDQGATGAAGLALARLLRRVRGPRHRSALLDRLGFGSFNAPFAPNRTRFDWLSRDAAAVDAYVDDPLCGALATTGLWVDLLGGTALVNDGRQVARVPHDLPVLVLGGEADPVGDGGRAPRALATALRAAGLDDVSVRVYPGARHELFHETNRDEVVEDVLGWLDERVPRDRPAA